MDDAIDTGPDQAVHANVAYGVPAMLILADQADKAATMENAARSLGLAITGIFGVDDGIARIATGAKVDAVVMALAEEGGSADRGIEMLTAGARRGAFRSAMMVPHHLLDLAAARADHDDIMLLCEPGATELVTALALLMAPPAARVQDSGSPSLYPQLQELSEQMSQIARALASMSNGQGAPHIFHPPVRRFDVGVAPTRSGGGDVDSAHVRAIIRGRRLRDSYFPADLFADPAWDMLLDLVAARLEGRDVAVSSLCIAAAVPPTTALRWIKSLTEAGVFIRVADPHDGRRVFITLSDATADAMLNYLAAAQRMASPVA